MFKMYLLEDLKQKKCLTHSPFKIPAAAIVSWLLRTVKIPQCVAFGCSNQAKTRKDTSISFNKPLLQPKATHCGILTVRNNHDTSSARSALRAIQDGSRGNFKRAIEPIFGSR